MNNIMFLHTLQFPMVKLHYFAFRVKPLEALSEALRFPYLFFSIFFFFLFLTFILTATMLIPHSSAYHKGVKP